MKSSIRQFFSHYRRIGIVVTLILLGCVVAVVHPGTVKASGGYQVFLPLVVAPPAVPPDPTVAQAIDRLNYYRGFAGDPLVVYQAQITKASQSHANYYIANWNNSAAEANGAHGEVSGYPYYTGTGPLQRLQAQGYTYWGGSEVIHFLDNPLTSVDGWMATVYHRVILLDPSNRDAGYGYGQGNGVKVDVMDFGYGPTISTPAPAPLIYPADNETGVPTGWSGGESPNPLPPNTPTPVGYPITLQGVGGTLQVTYALLRDSSNQVVAVLPNPASCSSWNCYAMIPASPLKPNTTYSVYVIGNVAGVSFQHTWHFTTGNGQTL